MKKLLFLLFPVFSYGQVTINQIGGSFSTSGIGSISGGALQTGKLYIVFAGTSNSGGTPATVSLSGTGQTWTEIGVSGGGLNTTSGTRIQAFRYVATNTNSINFTYTGAQDGGFGFLYEISGVWTTGTNGSDAILQSAAGFSNSANPNTTFGSIQPNASIILALINDANPFGGTPESGWTEDLDGGYATPNTGGYLMYRTNTTDNSPTVTAASSAWASIAIELNPRSRRATVIN